MDLLAAALLAIFGADRQLAASGAWNVDYAEAHCALGHRFASGKDELTLAIMATPGRTSVDLVVIEPTVAYGTTRPASMTVMLPGGLRIHGNEAVGGTAKGGGRITRGHMKRDQFEAFRAATEIELSVDGRKASMKLPQMKSAMDALSVCEADLLKQWGHDPQVIARIATLPAPLGTPQNWVTDSDYPAGPLRRREQGVVTFRLDIDATGKTSNCAVLESSGVPELDQAVCKNMLLRTKFSPARDAAGNALPSMFVSRFTWRIPQ